MAKRKRKKRTKKRLKSRTKKPQGFVKIGKKYALVFGTKTKPKLGKKRFTKKKTLQNYYAKKYA